MLNMSFWTALTSYVLCDFIPLFYDILGSIFAETYLPAPLCNLCMLWRSFPWVHSAGEHFSCDHAVGRLRLRTSHTLSNTQLNEVSSYVLLLIQRQCNTAQNDISIQNTAHR